MSAQTTISGPRAVLAVLRKDLRLELRSFELLPAMGLLALGTMIVLRFALDQETVEGDLAAGSLLVPLLFASLLGISRLFAGEERDAGIQQYLLSPAPAGALLAAKVLGLTAVLVALEIVLVPAFGLLLLGPELLPVLPELVLVLLLLDLTLATLGGIVAGIAIGARSRELIVPILVVPLAIPALIAAQQALAPVLEPGAEALAWRWPAVLAIYAVVLALVGSVVGEYLVED
ncbi:MAG: heme exporter protein CcmB [Solirubrobacteraceae bacterium]|nr:heme exporter protein CcmB [Solirubrobacteraceae bacterium]